LNLDLDRLHLLQGQASGPAAVDAAGFRGGDALLLSIPDQTPLELRDRAEDLQLEHGKRVSM
jgi:hypothetical protein